MAEITARDVIQVVVGVLIAAVMVGVLVPVLNEMTGEGGALAEYSALVGIIPMVLVVVILIMAISPILKRNF